VTMYPHVTDFSAEILDDLLRGMQRAMAKNPDPAFSVHKLIGRAVNDLIILSPDTKKLALICEIAVDDFGKKYLFVWGAYATIDFNLKKVYATLEWAAKETGCSYIEASSQRNGWAAKAEAFGLEVLPNTTYRKYL